MRYKDFVDTRLDFDGKYPPIAEVVGIVCYVHSDKCDIDDDIMRAVLNFNIMVDKSTSDILRNVAAYKLSLDAPATVGRLAIAAVDTGLKVVFQRGHVTETKYGYQTKYETVASALLDEDDVVWLGVVEEEEEEIDTCNTKQGESSYQPTTAASAERPSVVFAADGKPIKANETIYRVDGVGGAFVVKEINLNPWSQRWDVELECIEDRELDTFRPSQVTHEKPVDTWDTIAPSMENSRARIAAGREGGSKTPSKEGSKRPSEEEEDKDEDWR